MTTGFRPILPSYGYRLSILTRSCPEQLQYAPVIVERTADRVAAVA